jgi:hypothetical protein
MRTPLKGCVRFVIANMTVEMFVLFALFAYGSHTYGSQIPMVLAS